MMCPAFRKKGIENVSAAHIVDLSVLNQTIKIVDILSPVAAPRHLLKHGAIFLRDEIDKTVGEQFLSASHLQYLDFHKRLIERYVDFNFHARSFAGAERLLLSCPSDSREDFEPQGREL